jgi:glycosyltransferase involved in cell wall biosynthesis
MRVAVFAFTNDEPTLDTGVTTYNRELIQALCTRFPAHSFAIYLAEKNAEKFSSIRYANLEKIVLPRHPAAAPGNGEPPGGRAARVIWQLRFFARELLHRLGLRRFVMRRDLFESFPRLREFDLFLYTVYGYLPDFPLFVRRELRKPCVSAIHDVRVLYEGTRDGRAGVIPRHLVSRYVLWRIIHEGDCALVPSGYIQRLIASGLADRAGQVRVSYVVPNIQEVPAGPEGLSPRVRELLRTGCKYVFYPSTIVETKNHLTLARAIHILKARVPAIRLVLSGSNADSELGKRLSAFVSECGLQENILHLGFITEEDKHALYRSAVALVIPSIGESFSLPIWEAFALGCPVIASTDRDIPEQVGEAAIACNPHDPEDIARQIERVWVDDSLREKLRMLGRLRYDRVRQESLFTGWERIIQ